MSTATLKVRKPGILTTIQDLGRYQYQQFGMVVSGAMDPYALRVGNLLVGNNQSEAGLEITLIGPELEILEDTVMAICGANLSPTLDHDPLPLWRSFLALKGQRLRFGERKEGARAYLTIAGGVDVPTVMNSKSTYSKASIGGIKGRALQKGDILHCCDRKYDLKKVKGRRLHSDFIPHYKKEFKAKVILGPEEKAFSTEGMTHFLNSSYKITNQSDRMGYRLTGPKITHIAEADILSDAIALGTIQIPANGEPIILLAERQTTGGYTRIATVISVDIPYLAQLAPGDHLSFKAITVHEAQELYKKQERFLKALASIAKVN